MTRLSTAFAEWLRRLAPWVAPVRAGGGAWYRLALRFGSRCLIQDLYRGLLGRGADAAGLATYGPQVAAGNLSSVIAEIAKSREAWDRLLPEHSDELVELLLRGLLNRKPPAQTVIAYGAQLRNSSDLSGLLASIVQSQEHWGAQLASRAEELVRLVYLALLKREPDEPALRAYAVQLREDRDLLRLVATIARSQEHWGASLSLRTDELLRAVYEGLLQREPDEPALASYGAPLRESRDLSRLLASIAQSPECWESQLAARAEAVAGTVCEALLKAKPDAQKVAAYAADLRRERNLTKLVAAVADSDEHRRAVASNSDWPHPAASRDRPALVFLHIQKTAGTSLQNMLHQAFAADGVYREYDDTLHLHSPAELSTYSVFAGHFNHDSLAFIPRRKLNLVTFVREPKKRLISLYQFWRAHEPSHPSYAGGVVLANEASPEEFFAKVAYDWGIWNHMTWAVMGDRQWREWQRLLYDAAGDAKAGSVLLREIIRPAIHKRLHEFAFLGLQEDFDRSVRLLFKILNRPAPPVRLDHSLERMLGTTAGFKKEMRRQPLSAATDAALDGLVALDNIVYSEARRIYAERLRKAFGLRQPRLGAATHERGSRRVRRGEQRSEP